MARLTEAQARALCAKVEEKAAAYFAKPSAGYNAGYRPAPLRRAPEAPILSAGHGRDHSEGPAPPSFADWLRGVARIDLAGHRWEVSEYVGQGTGSADLAIVL